MKRPGERRLARASLAFLRGGQVDNVLTPLQVPDGSDTFDIDTLFADSRFGFEITRDGDGPGDLPKPHRFWPMRQMFGARLAVSLTLQANPPRARMLHAFHVSDPCGKVLVDWGHISSVATPARFPPRPNEAADRR